MLRSSLLLLLLVLAPVPAAGGPLEDGKLLLKKRQYTESIPLFTQAAASDPSGEAEFCLAMAYEGTGDAPHAIEAYRKVVDGKGPRAAEAERSLEALESAARELSARDTARVEFEKAGIDRSKRVMEAKQRAEAATEKLILRKIDAQKVYKVRTAAEADFAAAEKAKSDADTQLASWKAEGLRSPAGHGSKLRGLGILGITLGGVALGASAWFIRTGIVGTREIERPTQSWTNADVGWQKWGTISNTGMKIALPLGALLTVGGIVSLRYGEGAVGEREDAAKVTRDVEAGR